MITISSTDTAKIYFQGSDVEIVSIEARLEFTAPMDGKTIQVALSPYSIGVLLLKLFDVFVTSKSALK